MDLHILAHINKMCPDDTYSKLKIYTSELLSTMNMYQYHT